jgi:hypothetical protein
VPASSAPPPLAIDDRARPWEVEQLDGTLIARASGKHLWQREQPFTALLGAVYLPARAPMIRGAAFSGEAGAPELRLIDLDATGATTGPEATTPVPGIGVLAHAISPVGDVALAVRLDRSLAHDYIAGYAANAQLRWVSPLPSIARADPIGVAVGLDAARAPVAVVVFHDGDTVTILPALSSSPTAPGAIRGPSENATP